jgi:AcrR family transcriptional regulator
MAGKTQGNASGSYQTGADIVAAAKALLAGTPWHRISLADIALRAKVPLSELYRRYPLRSALMLAVLRDIDMEALGRPIETEGSARDRLFESLMRRLDVLAPFKESMRVTARELRCGHTAVLPTAFLTAIHGNYALGWYIEAAGIPVQGLTGLARVKLVSMAYLSALRVWLRDDGEDSSRSMAALDRALGRIWPLMRVRVPRDGDADRESEGGEEPEGDPQPTT